MGGAVTVAAAEQASAEHPHASITPRPFIGVLAVLLGSIISTLDSRITSFGLADLRGAVHAGFDEGAWITTAFTVAQMMIGPVSVWLGLVFGPRRVLVISSAVFAVSNLLLPFSPALASSSSFRPSAASLPGPSFRSPSALWCRICRPALSCMASPPTR
jgi:MFS family permease